jgi:hypothetical protein
LAYWTRALATLGGIPLDELSSEEKVNAQVLRASIHALSNEIKFRTYEAPFNSDTFFWTDFTPRLVSRCVSAGGGQSTRTLQRTRESQCSANEGVRHDAR